MIVLVLQKVPAGDVTTMFPVGRFGPVLAGFIDPWVVGCRLLTPKGVHDWRLDTMRNPDAIAETVPIVPISTSSRSTVPISTNVIGATKEWYEQFSAPVPLRADNCERGWLESTWLRWVMSAPLLADFNLLVQLTVVERYDVSSSPRCADGSCPIR